MTLLEAMHDPNLFGGWFSGKSWTAWCAFLAALSVWPSHDKEACCSLFQFHQSL